MIAIFKQKSPGNAFVLLLYGLIIKFPIFLHPATNYRDEGDNYLYQGILNFLELVIRHVPVLMSVLTFLLFFMEATLLNRMVNSLKLFPRSNYLTGMAYMLISSLFPEWSDFSAILILNGLLIWIWYRLLGLYNNNNPKSAIFNVAVLIGLLPLIYAPAIVYLLLLILALFVTRSFKITELLVALLGLITPYYFFFVVLYLAGEWGIEKIVPAFNFYLPRLPSSLWVSGGIILLLVPFLMGGFYVQGSLNKMLIQVRKAWSLMLLLLIVSLIIILINPGQSYISWMVIIVPLAAFHAATYFYLQKRWLALLLHWVSFVFVIMLNYGAF